MRADGARCLESDRRCSLPTLSKPMASGGVVHLLGSEPPWKRRLTWTSAARHSRGRHGCSRCRPCPHRTHVIKGCVTRCPQPHDHRRGMRPEVPADHVKGSRLRSQACARGGWISTAATAERRQGGWISVLRCSSLLRPGASLALADALEDVLVHVVLLGPHLALQGSACLAHGAL